MKGLVGYLIRVGDAFSQLANVVFFNSKNPNESISGRSWRMRKHPFWGKIRVLVDWLASPFEEDHCRKSHEADIGRAEKFLAEKGF
jgi:cell division inhibitor SulA